jgi:hypothetical protein
MRLGACFGCGKGGRDWLGQWCTDVSTAVWLVFCEERIIGGSFLR